MIPNIHQCEFCSATFVKKESLEKHECKFMQRYNNVTKTKRGIAMYQMYLHWLKKSGKSVKYVDAHTFIHSTQYNHFQRFIKFAAEKGLPDSYLYAEMMGKKGILPQHWRRDDVLEYFLERYDCDVSPKKHIAKSVETILRLSDALECDTSDIFQQLDNHTILVLLQSRKLSPWLLLNSTKFKEYLVSSASAAERDYIQRYINPQKWKKILNENKKLISDIKLILEEFGL